MARYIFDNPDLVYGKKVLDFGCGSGVAAIAAKLAGASEVIACDLDQDAISASRANAALNEAELRYSGDFFANDDVYDLILVADVLYDRANLPLLDAFLKRAPKVLVADSRVKDFQVDGYQWLRSEERRVGKECRSFSAPLRCQIWRNQKSFPALIFILVSVSELVANRFGRQQCQEVIPRDFLCGFFA